MITPISATIIMCVLGLFLMFIIPVLDASKTFGKYISLRYTLVVITTLMALGCVLDFSHLNESSRNIAVTGGLVLVGIFILVRSLEKIKLGNRTFEVKVSKGDTTAEAKLGKEESENGKTQD